MNVQDINKGLLCEVGKPNQIRFWAKVDKNGPTPLHRPDLGPCWLWTASKNPHGYGQFVMEYEVDGAPRKQARGAHRVAYEMAHGPIPKGMQLDHLCHVRACVNDAHLEVVTQQTNLLRGDTFQAKNAAKTHCPKGP